MVALLLLLAACDDDPTQDEANQQFCDDVGVFAAALGDLRDIDKDTPVSEFEDARENVRIAYDNMIASAEQVRDVRLDDLQEANENLQKSGVGDRVRFLNQDLFTTNLSEATVVTLYLLPSLNVKLMPKLKAELKPGTRIVSHAFDMGDWVPEQTLDIDGRRVYFWTIPKQ